nr:AbiH family protein [uncultured Treponema sp.]
MKLFIIGNGFDLAHGYKTSYGSFREYLSEKGTMEGAFYIPDIFSEASESDWSNFEQLLEDYDFVDWGAAYASDIYVEDDRQQDSNMSYNNRLNDSYREIASYLPSTIRTELCSFIEEATSHKASKIESVEKLIKPRDLFVTFNYSFTLEDLYKVKKTQILHIHKTIYCENEIIFGHGNQYLKSNPNPPEFDLSNPAGQLCNLNYEFKKNYQISSLINFLDKKHVTQIIILGHGLGNIDSRYFQKLNTLFPHFSFITYYFHYDKNLKNPYNQTISKEDQIQEKQEILSYLFPNKRIKIVEW